MRVDQDWCASKIKQFTNQYFQICATNNHGTNQLFEEIDRLKIEFQEHPDDYYWQYVPQ